MAQGWSVPGAYAELSLVTPCLRENSPKFA